MAQQRKIIFFFENQKRTATIQTFGSDEYFSLSDFLPYHLSKRIELKPLASIELNGISFLFLSGAMFFEISTKYGQNAVLQMKLPVISFSNQIYVPFKSFINALSSLKFLELKILENKIFVKLVEQKSDKKITLSKTNPTEQGTNVLKRKTEPNDFSPTQQHTPSSTSLPKFIKLTKDYFLLNPQENDKFNFKSGTYPKWDTITNVPPKYYVLPPIIKK